MSSVDILRNKFSTNEESINMVKMINKLTGTVMYVEEDRKGEYVAAGHRLVNDSTSKAVPKPETKAPELKETVKKTIAKVKAKTTRKKG